MSINSNKQFESTIFEGGDKGFERFKTRMRNLGEGKGRFVKKTDSSISGKKGSKGILRSTSKFKKRIRERTSRDEKRRRSHSCQVSLRAKKSRLESERRLKI